MSDPFVHLHVASGYSMRHGANHPADLVARAADHGMGALALTDRDGLYGAVKFAQSCLARGIDPILGADLALGEVAGQRARPAGRTPVRGGAVVDPRLPRVTVLARGRSRVEQGHGWARLCRLDPTVDPRSVEVETRRLPRRDLAGRPDLAHRPEPQHRQGAHRRPRR